MTSLYMAEPASLYWNWAPAAVTAGSLYEGSTWTSYTHAYLYGSHYRQLRDHQVEWENQLMPAGAVIYRWDEVYSYNSGRTVPPLPLLKHQQTYQVTLQADLDQEAGVYIRLTFFTFAGKRVGIKVIRALSGTFEYPAAADLYAVELLSAGCKHLRFRRLDLVAIASADQPLDQAALDAQWQLAQQARATAVATIKRFLGKGGVNDG